MASGESIRSGKERRDPDLQKDIPFDRICARRGALMAQWATTVLDPEDAQSYADELARMATTGDAELLSRIKDDFQAAGIEIMDEVLQDRMISLLRSAAAELRRLEPHPGAGSKPDLPD